MPLTTLPEEIIVCIIVWLTKPDLKAVTRCCKSLARITKPYLWDNVTWAKPGPTPPGFLSTLPLGLVRINLLNNEKPIYDKDNLRMLFELKYFSKGLIIKYALGWLPRPLFRQLSNQVHTIKESALDWYWNSPTSYLFGTSFPECRELRQITLMGTAYMDDEDIRHLPTSKIIKHPEGWKDMMESNSLNIDDHHTNVLLLISDDMGDLIANEALPGDIVVGEVGWVPTDFGSPAGIDPRG